MAKVYVAIVTVNDFEFEDSEFQSAEEQANIHIDAMRAHAPKAIFRWPQEFDVIIEAIDKNNGYDLDAC